MHAARWLDVSSGARTHCGSLCRDACQGRLRWRSRSGREFASGVNFDQLDSAEQKSSVVRSALSGKTIS